MKNNSNNPCKFNIGDWVFVVEYEDDEPVDISGYILLMTNDKFALLSPALGNTEDPDKICNSYYREYQEYRSDCDCVIVPITELFTKEEADAKLASGEPCSYDCDDNEDWEPLDHDYDDDEDEDWD